MAAPYVERAATAVTVNGSPKKDRLTGAIELPTNNPPPLDRQGNVQCFLTTIWAGGRCGYVFDVRLIGGETIVRRSHDPETDAARVLRARGLTGSITLVDGSTGRARAIISIDGAAKVRTVEESRKGLRFRRYAERGSSSPHGPGRGAP